MMRRIAIALLLLATAALPAAAADWTFDGDASPDAFRDFQRRLAAAAYDYPRHGAAPLGLLGFEVWADATYDRKTGDEGFAREAVSGDLPAGVLSIARVGVRKGLPGRIDLGVSYGTAVRSDIRLVSADVQWSMLKGGLLSPALALRLTGTQTTGNSRYDLEQEGAELVLSKGFPLFHALRGRRDRHQQGHSRPFRERHLSGPRDAAGLLWRRPPQSAAAQDHDRGGEGRRRSGGGPGWFRDLIFGI
jgi:hypothetical protein